jgi:ubiquinone/menaquinone biosynthesis C-methylase UbiE
MAERRIDEDDPSELALGSGLYRRARPASEPPSVSNCSSDPELRSEAWGDCATAYELFAEGVTRPFAEDAVRLVKLGTGSRVLDVAAGTGAFALAAARQGAEVLATDFSAEMLSSLDEKCRRLGLTGVTTAEMDGQSLALPDASFDLAASLFGLMFFADHDRGLSELHRVLKPGGRAIVASWASPARVEMMRLLGDATMQAMISLPTAFEPPRWTALADARKLKQRLLGLGFARAHVVSVAHVWTFERAQHLAEILPLATPSSSALFNHLSAEERGRFVAALVDDLQARQGDGPYAVTNEAVIAVATKAAD